ncbi:MAG: B12-binding domain-containing radical SAM protein, partial [Lachnospiraceae bacterium]|nr:B12-binding domain-containing radical SAM protein [Lachnospiraceae bacterium]
KVAKAILAAYNKGCIYDAWGEQFHYDRWLDAFEETGLDLDFYTTRARELDEVFPWDFIDIGVTKKFLEREWKRATDETVTPNCRMQCSGCGAMKYEGGVCYEH